MLLESLAAGLVALGLLWLVVQPIIAPATESAPVVEPPEPEETACGRALPALNEIDFDSATGKLSDADYAELQARYERAAIATMEGCGKCGGALGEQDLYCGACGARR